MLNGDLAAATRDLRIATAINPHRGRYWMELARADRFTGDVTEEGEALREAVRQNPADTNIAWDAAIMLLARGETAAAAQEFEIAAQQDQSRARSAERMLRQSPGDGASAVPSEPQRPVVAGR